MSSSAHLSTPSTVSDISDVNNAQSTPSGFVSTTREHNHAELAHYGHPQAFNHTTEFKASHLCRQGPLPQLSHSHPTHHGFSLPPLHMYTPGSMYLSHPAPMLHSTSTRVGPHSTPRLDEKPAPSDDELEQPLLPPPAKGKKCASAPSGQVSKPLAKKEKTEVQSKVGKGKGMAKPKLEPDGSEARKKGCKAGATGYSIQEVEHLLKEINRCIPLSGKAWDAVTVSYNVWAQRNCVSEHSTKAIRAKYDAITRIENPTGDATISLKAGTIALDDSEWDDGASDGKSDMEVKDVVEISTDDDEEPKSVKSKHAGPKKSVVKAFHANPLLEPGLRRPRTTAASEALSSLTSVFNPTVMKDCDESQLSQMVQFNQINTLQTELPEAHLRIEGLNNRLLQEARHADRAESQVEMLKYMLSSCDDSQPYHSPSRSHYSPPRQQAHTDDSRPFRTPTPSRSHYSPPRRRPYHHHHSSPSRCSPQWTPTSPTLKHHVNWRLNAKSVTVTWHESPASRQPSATARL
ncbi:uncharacterized protein F5147DRAFT_777798 [Suillus discolor]|uniref:Uncharacterized protein n=1 Tax=Suillus discolor TaxID=1912936 RepID=A0A9P7JQ60_9AGAM|nr:uncharacterized protein F5147DRAFT_777798 [Suillus discolor]KAG2097929.1 hypothetical protein F5147DRAFT_777798 [Suillus discolor]